MAYKYLRVNLNTDLVSDAFNIHQIDHNHWAIEDVESSQNLIEDQVESHSAVLLSKSECEDEVKLAFSISKSKFLSSSFVQEDRFDSHRDPQIP